MRSASPLLAALAAAHLAACQRPAGTPATALAAKAPEPVDVDTAPVLVESVPRSLTLTGSVVADRQSEVAANVSGRVVATFVERGQAVTEGQVLAVVDAKSATLSATAAASQAQVAQSQGALAQLECERADTLFRQGAISKSELDRLKTQCTAQLHAADAARTNAELAAKLAGDAVIRSPLKGIVGERLVNVGEFVQPSTRVASVYGVNPARVTVSVPESAVAAVRPGLTLELEVAAYPGRRFPATVRFVSPVLRAATRDLIVEAVAPNDELLLRPGMFATLHLVVGEVARPTVPAEAIVSSGAVRRLFLARADAARELVVRTLGQRGGRVALDEELRAGELVVVRPPPGLRDGAPIR